MVILEATPPVEPLCAAFFALDFQVKRVDAEFDAGCFCQRDGLRAQS